MAPVLEIPGILLSLVLLMVLAYRGISVIILAPVLAMLAVLLSADRDQLLAIYTQVFMYGVLGFVVKYFPVFLLGAIFGKLMEDSGSARCIALEIMRSLGPTRTIPAIVLACALLTYGGVSVFVVVFAVYPIAASVFREAHIPKRLIPATVVLGSATFSMTCLPGTVQIQNIIPTAYFGTSIYAAPVLGTVCGLLIMVLGLTWLKRRAAAIAHEGYGNDLRNEPARIDDGHLPALTVALLPVIVVVGTNFVFFEVLIPAWDTSYLASAKFGNTSVDTLASLWAIIAGLFAGNMVVIAVNLRRLHNVNESLGAGAISCMLPTFNTGSEVGYGTTIASLAGFALIKAGVVDIAPGYPLISASLAVNTLAGITGSASGGMSIALAALGDTFANMAREAGVSLELMHRVISMSAGGFDSLPHNGAIITILTICGLTHRQAYPDIGMVSLVIPFSVVFGATVVVSLML
ncbi:GntP family permease [Pseudohaliea sp.]|uniref:GntP family permease n=1 Tax=Pseudohaliea sp. TaxID=2740289 RepID=UPI0032EFA584